MRDGILAREVLDVIRSQYDNIFSAEKKVADFVLNHPDKTVNANVSELAKLSGVSDATVVRTCHHLGYKGYYQFRITLSRDLGKQKKEVGKEENAIDKVFGNLSDMLLDIGRSISAETMNECVSMIKNAKVVHVLAVGNAANVAQYLGFRLGRLGIRSTYNVSPEYCINHINLADQEDILIAISKSGTSKQVIRGVELAKEKQMKVIAVTSSEQSPISELADQMLLCSEKNEMFYIGKKYSYLSELAVIDAMLIFVEDDDQIQSLNAEEPELILSENKL